jgi:hypothetical protein
MQRLSIAASILVATTVSAYAQPSDTTSLAQQLFNQGRDLAKNNDWAAACPKFEASLRYDPALGTRLNLATCYDKIGKIASAWGIYRDAAELAGKAGDGKRREYALKQAAALERRLPKLTITAPTPAPGLAVTRDGVPIDPSAFGTPLYVDPGSHEVKASAPGFVTATLSVTLAESKTETVTIPVLIAAPVSKPEKPEIIEKPTQPERTVSPVEAPPSPTRKYLGIGATAAGAVALAVGVGFGVKARSTYQKATDLCGADRVCDSQTDFDRGHSLVSDARSQATLSTVLVIGGGVVAAAGVVLWLTAPSASHTETARIVPTTNGRDAGLALVGRF